MAVITSPKLELLEHNHERKIARLRVTYTVLLSSVERQMAGLRYREDVELWGADSPDPDDFLFRFPTASFAAQPDGSVGRSRTVTLGDEILDEDGFLRPTDEVYARVRVTPLLPTGSTARTNEIEHRF